MRERVNSTTHAHPVMPCSSVSMSVRCLMMRVRSWGSAGACLMVRVRAWGCVRRLVSTSMRMFLMRAALLFVHPREAVV